MLRSLIVVPLLPLLALFGCGEEEVMCTEMAAVSAMVHVVDSEGNPLAAEVTATDAAGQPVQAVCAEMDASDGCSDWNVGYEVEGVIEIHAEVYDGCNYGSGDGSVDVPLDESGCHVVGQDLTITIGEWTDLDCG